MLNKVSFNNWFNQNYEINDNNKIKVKGKNRYLSESDVYTFYNKVISVACLPMNFTEQEVIDEIKAKYKVQNVNPKQSCRDWIIKKINNNHHWKFNRAMTEIEYDAGNQGIYMSSGLDDLYDRLVENNADEDKPFDVGTIKSVLNNISKDAISNYLTNVYNQIKYDSNYSNVDDYLRGLYDYLKPIESFDIFKVIVKHWAWQVKRKLLGKSVRNHIWINFYGGTGLGKSTMIKEMCKVMDEFVSTTSIAKLFDDTKEIKRLTEKYILNFDELAINGNEPGDGFLAADQLALLKQMLTGDYIDARVYGTQNQSRRKITFTCISSANYHLYDTIFDEQSMRRFFEFHCEATKPKSYEEIDKVLALSNDFWKGIDESNDMGYWNENDTTIWNEIESIQKNYFPTKTTVSQWLSFNNITQGNKTAKEVYPMYKEWCDENGFKNKKSLPSFIEELKRRFPTYIGNDGIFRLDISINTTPKVSTQTNKVNNLDDYNDLCDTTTTSSSVELSNDDCPEDCEDFFTKLSKEK